MKEYNYTVFTIPWPFRVHDRYDNLIAACTSKEAADAVMRLYRKPALSDAQKAKQERDIAIHKQWLELQKIVDRKADWVEYVQPVKPTVIEHLHQWEELEREEDLYGKIRC